MSDFSTCISGISKAFPAGTLHILSDFPPLLYTATHNVKKRDF